MRRNSENELSPKDLKDICNPSIFNFETTKEIEDTYDLIYGQDRGLKALAFGIDIDVKGYNLYIEGPSGVGKTMYTKKISIKKKLLKRKLHAIGVIFIILRIQMSQLHFHFQQVKEKYLRKIWKVL